MLLLLPKTLKGSRNIQGVALIRAVLLSFYITLSKGTDFGYLLDHEPEFEKKYF